MFGGDKDRENSPSVISMEDGKKALLNLNSQIAQVSPE